MKKVIFSILMIMFTLTPAVLWGQRPIQQLASQPLINPNSTEVQLIGAVINNSEKIVDGANKITTAIGKSLEEQKEKNETALRSTKFAANNSRCPTGSDGVGWKSLGEMSESQHVCNTYGHKTCLGNIKGFILSRTLCTCDERCVRE